MNVIGEVSCIITRSSAPSTQRGRLFDYTHSLAGLDIMTSALSRQTYITPIVLVAVLVTAIAWPVGQLIGEVDRELFEKVIGSLVGNFPRSSDLYPVTPAWTQAIERLIGLSFAMAATWVGFRLALVPRLVVLLQLFILSLICQWALWQWLGIICHPLSYLTVLFLSGFGGYVLQDHYNWQRLSQARSFELALRNKELQEAKLQIVRQEEVERRLLAGDLHDQVLNDLKAVKHKVDSYFKEPDEATAKSIQSLLDQAAVEVREVMESLCPSSLEKLGLIAAIKECVSRGGERAGFRSHVKSTIKKDDLQSLSMVQQSLLYRLVQESITNIVKHAEASTVLVSMLIEKNQLIISINDNGKGIDPAKLRSDSRGVRYMRQRADLIGATIAWKPSDTGRGTTVEIRLTLPEHK